jgi:hypothetical protein
LRVLAPVGGTLFRGELLFASNILKISSISEISGCHLPLQHHAAGS